MSSIAVNINEIKDRIAKAANKAGRDPKEIEIIAVTKSVSVKEIRELLALDINKIGENRVQELLKKYTEIDNQAKWHMIGHLQTNKVRQIIDKVELIHSLERWSLAKELNKRAGRINRRIPALIQVNIAKEKSKFGLFQEEVIPFVKKTSELPHIAIKGLMTMAPFAEDPEEVRYVFRELRKLSKEIQKMDLEGVEMDYLSMGMTNDFEIAVEEGANLVRIGSGIFGKRN